ncbi:hypothetical protein TWF694_000679 [Orbilia ellipsospora]|uniref:Large ribosomal subunit protein mL54 n=1 Tax=Orbilia ellipsospora TaxID=2528407 RepID=A0AAV9XQ76_9PEZI
MSVCVQCAFRYSSRSAGTAALARPSFSKAFILPQFHRRLISSSSSTPVKTPSAARPGSDPSAAKPKIVSSVPAGTVLKGLHYNKRLTEPVALADDEYPEWLWKVLEDRRPRLSSATQMTSEDSADLYSKSKGRRKAAQKRIAAREAAGVADISTPADHMTEDMPFETFEESQEAIKAAKRASRERRRADIKERNFLGKLG